MTGRRIALFTDEMVYRDLAPALRQRGYGAVSSQEAQRAGQGFSDEEQLAYAAAEERAILTRDVVDYLRLDAQWRAHGREHAGIILYVRIYTLSDLARRVMEHLDNTSPETQYNTVLFL